jgi:hypothetical protein
MRLVRLPSERAIEINKQDMVARGEGRPCSLYSAHLKLDDKANREK